MNQSRRWSDLLGRNLVRPGSVALWTESQLLVLAATPPSGDPPAWGALVGELLLRHWLYEDRCSPELAGAADALATPDLRALIRGDEIAAARADHRLPPGWSPPTSGRSEGERAAREHFIRRARAFLQADGIFPVVWRATGEALAIPFCLRGDDSAGERCRDVDGIPLPGWSAGVRELERHTGLAALGFTLLAAADAVAADLLVGDSFGLALLLAAARRDRRLPEFAPLAVLSTGTFAADGFARVGHLPAKAALARRLGARLFVAPEGEAGSLDVPVGSPAVQTLDLVRRELERKGLGRLSVLEACQKIAQLQTDLRLDRETPASAEKLLRFCVQALDAGQPDPGPASPNRIERARGQAAGIALAIANHRGDPGPRAQPVLHPGWLPSAANVETAAHEVVNLTDQGGLLAAERLARDLLARVQAHHYTDEDEALRCAMISHGVLGGQPLLHAAVACGCGPDARLAWESLEHSRQAYRLACQLAADRQGEERAREACRDAVQIALWHALLAAPSADAEWTVARDFLRCQPAAYSVTSLEYLRRTRFLATYRRWRLHGQTEPCATSMDGWKLPTVTIPWLRATALKYRAALRAAAGRATEAEADFREGWDLLCRTEGALLRFVGLTILVQAGESLQGLLPQAADNFLRIAEENFFPFKKFLTGTPYASALWLTRVVKLRTARMTMRLPDPQSVFIY